MKSDFRTVLESDREISLSREVCGFVKHTGKWWLLPLLVPIVALAYLRTLFGR